MANSDVPLFCSINGAENGTRTRDPNLGKVVLYQLSYFRIFFDVNRQPLSIADAKVMLFSELTNFLGIFFRKKYHFIENRPFFGINPSCFGSLRSQIRAESPSVRLYGAYRLRDEKCR